MTPYMLGIYVLFCLLLAFVGRKTRVGAFGIFLLSVIFTPLVVGLVFAIVRPMPASKANKSPQSSENG